MKRNSASTPPSKSNSGKPKKSHGFSRLLGSDSRVQAAPRHVHPIGTQKLQSGDVTFLVKVYATLEAPGSELLTVSCVSFSGEEVEMRFDEKFPVSIRFKKQTDPERIAYAQSQITAAGGLGRLLEFFQSSFPKFRV